MVIVDAVKLPAIRFALPLASETRWSDMLAVLIATDPQPLCRVLDVDDCVTEVTVRREAAVDAANHPDTVVERAGRRLAVIEVKVLAGLGVAQLERYASAVPDAGAYLLVFPERLVIDVAHVPRWRGITWEYLLHAYQASANPWVATCAASWSEHLGRSLPYVGADTVWNDLVNGEDFVIAMRARMSWLHRQLAPPPLIEHDLVASTAGVSWVVRMYADAQAPGYQIMIEAEENLPVRDFPKHAGPGSRQPRGPSIKVCLLQHSVQTSAGFDWTYLLRMWPLMNAARSDWVTNPARPRAEHDRDGHQTMVASGGPRYLGIGFGEAQTKISRACMFGARVQLPPNAQLGYVATSLREMYQLIGDMAKVDPSAPTVR